MATSQSSRRSRASSSPAFLAGGGEMGARMRDMDWAATPLGPIERWPQSLRSTLSMLLPSKAQIILFWGPEFICLYNDAYRPVFGAKHPHVLGRPGREAWREIWDAQLHPLLEGVVRTGEAFWAKDLLFALERYGFAEETYFDVSYDPVRVESGAVGGVFCIVTETTERVIGERRMELLKDLAAHNATARTVRDACRLATDTLAAKPHAFTFALAYVDGALQSATPGAPEKRAAAPPDAVRELALRASSAGGEAGRLVVGPNPRRPFDESYRTFVDLVADQVSTAIANAQEYENERRRAEALAEIDRAKTAFFSNVSHEFRTPLTLLLGPVQDALSAPERSLSAEGLAAVHRNALRLLKLVNTLLDFARIEAGRAQADFEPTDLAALTADLAGAFRSAIESAGLVFEVTCEPIADPVHVDRSMWEKIVFNLLSNALKFTFAGRIGLALERDGDGVRLMVSDTGVGITEDDLPHVFERFHRVQGVRARTHEGTGIGLALVQELVRLHGGTVAVDSRPGEGATFVVRLPAAARERTGAPRALASTAVDAGAYVSEALGWIDAAGEPTVPAAAPAAAVPLPLVLLADDNADMRAYVGRLLGERWRVQAVADGAAALAAARQQRPDLIVADVMMPGLDGFGLLAAVREDPGTSDVPVILVSARAGEEATLKGITAGADDYLVKPFTARDLLTRVESQLTRARERAAMRDRMAQIEAVLENAPLGVYLVDQDFRLAHINAIARPVFGADLVGRDFTAVSHRLWNTDYADEVVRIFRHTLATGEPFVMPERAEFRIDRGVTEHYEWRVDRIRLADGRFGVVCYFRDISAAVRARERIWESETRQAFLLGLNDALRPLTNPADIMVTAARMIGEQLAADRAFFDERPPEIRDRDAAALLEGGVVAVDRVPDRAGLAPAATATDTAASPGAYVVCPLMKDGACVASLTVQQSAPRAWAAAEIGLVRETAERTWIAAEHARAEAALRRSQEDLREADRRKDEFLAVLAHELRNPLAPIRTGLELIRIAGDTPEAVGRVRAMMERQVAHIVRLIDDLLDVARITSGKIPLRREPSPLAGLVHTAIDANRAAMTVNQIQLTVNLPETPCVLDVDPTRFVQVLSNVLHNATKFTDAGGAITVSAAVGAAGEGGRPELTLRIADSGIGIAPELLPRVFDLFAQGDRGQSQPGLGIGLALARRLVERQGGRIAVHSDGPGRGTEVVIRMPISTETVAPGAAPRTLPVPVNCRVVIIDDNHDSAAAMAMLVGQLGGRCRVAHDGARGIREAVAHRPDLVLLDIGMPGMDGYETCRRIRRKLGPAPLIVAVTGFGQDRDKARADAAGFNAHLTKPADPAALATLLQRTSGGIPTGRRRASRSESPARATRR